MKQRISALLKLGVIAILFMNCFLLKGQGMFSERGSGYYWKKQGGEKIEGEFKISYRTHLSGNAVVKFYRNGKKVGRISLSDIQSLIINNDSFVVGYNFTLDSWANYGLGLLRVESVGNVSLYSHCRKVKQSYGNSIPIGYLVCAYVVKKQGSDKYYGIATKKQFESYFIPLIEDDELLKNKILAMKRRDWIDYLPSFINEYNNERH